MPTSVSNGPASWPNWVWRSCPDLGHAQPSAVARGISIIVHLIPSHDFQTRRQIDFGHHDGSELVNG
jgi:hypothetical protein